MRRFLPLSVVILLFAACGCESDQSKLDALTKEHDQLGDKFRADCTAETLKVPPTLSPKCAEESKKLDESWQRLKAEQAKQ